MQWLSDSLPKRGGDKFKVFVFCEGPYKGTISSYIIKQLLSEAEYDVNNRADRGR